jgi:hypothetical protein
VGRDRHTVSQQQQSSLTASLAASVAASATAASLTRRVQFASGAVWHFTACACIRYTHLQTFR